MKETKNNIILQVLYQLFSFLLPFITTPIIARAFGAEGLGEYSYAYTTMIYFSLFGLLGISTLGTRKIGESINDKEKLSKNFTNLYFIQFLFTLFVSIAYVIFVLCFTSDTKLYLLVGLYLLSTMLDINWLFYGLGKFGITVLRNSLIKVISFVLILLLVRSFDDIYVYALIISFSSLFSNILLWLKARKYIYFTKLDKHEIKRDMKDNFILFIPAIASSFFVYMDKILIGLLNSFEEVGYYEAMDKVLNFPLAIIYAVGEVLYSKSINLESQKKSEERKKLFNTSSAMLLLFIFGVMAGLLAVSPLFVEIYFGNEFNGVALLLSVALIYLPFRTMRLNIKNQILLPDKKEKNYIYALLVGAGVNLIFNILFIPRYGALGAILGTIAAEAISCILLIVVTRKYFKIGYFIQKITIFLVGGALMWYMLTVVNIPVQNDILRLAIEVVIGVLIYFTLVYLFIKIYKLFIRKEEGKNEIL